MAPTTPHICLAFDPFANELERERLGAQVTQLLHPKTQQLFEDLSSVGKFPRKQVARRAKIAPLKLQQEFRHPSGSRSARTHTPGNIGEAVSAPVTAPEVMAETETSFASKFSAIAAAEAPGSMWHAVDKQSAPLQDAGERLKAFFPASARSAAH